MSFYYFLVNFTFLAPGEVIFAKQACPLNGIIALFTQGTLNRSIRHLWFTLGITNPPLYKHWLTTDFSGQPNYITWPVTVAVAKDKHD
jgi:hypothetical protein